MPAENIFQAYAQPLRSVADYGADIDRRSLLQMQLQGTQRQNALADLTVQQQVQANDLALKKQSALMAIYSDPTIKTQAAREAALLSHPLLMDVGQAAQKARLDAEHVAAQTQQQQALAGKTGQETADAALTRYRGAIDRAQTPEEAAQIMTAQYSDPVLRPHMPNVPLEQSLARIPTDPQGFQQWKLQQSQGMAKALEFMAPKPVHVRVGNEDITYDENPQSPTFRGILARVAIQESPDAALAAKTSRANNAATILAENTRAGQAVTYQTDANGNIVALPSKVAPGMGVKATAVSAPGPGVSPLAGKDAVLNAEQSNALTFASRMQAAHAILNDLQGKYSPAAVNTKTGLGTVYGVGGALEAGANLLLTPEGQRADQAQRDFVNAILRRESGAAISAGEFQNAAKEYFPQAGDSKQVIEQKRQSRERSIQGLLQAVPVKSRAAFKTLSAPQTAGAPTVTNW